MNQNIMSRLEKKWGERNKGERIRDDEGRQKKKPLAVSALPIPKI
jgi:hypothetical protein